MISTCKQKDIMGVDFYTSCFVDCSAVTIQITYWNGNEWKTAETYDEMIEIIGVFLYGSFKRSSDVNEKPSYMGEYQQHLPYAIWYAEEAWWIGLVANLGKSIGVIYTKDDFDRLDFENIVWNYWSGSEWKTAGKDAVFFECDPREFRDEQE